MSLSRLRTFMEVYRHKSISAAARSLNLTQPAVSQHIAGLEATIGRRLFVRDSQGVNPTPAADELATDVGDKLDAAEAALASARTRSAEVAGALRIVGHVDFLAEVVAAELIPLLALGVRVRLQGGGRHLIEQMLIDGDCDLGISAYASVDVRLRCEAIRRERVLAVAAPAVVARLLAAGDLRQNLPREPLLAYNLELPLIEPWLLKNGMNPQPIVPVLVGQDLRSLRSLLCRGFGWTAMPEYLCRQNLDRGELAEIPAPEVSTYLEYFLVWAPAALRQPRVAHARQTLLQQLAGGRVPAGG